jgi:thiamine biosynthesis lipoprotein
MALVRTAFPALGTTAVVVAADVEALLVAERAVRREIERIDRGCSRFRPDSDLSRVNASAGRWVEVGEACLEAVSVALRAALLTNGDVDPTVGAAMIGNGYDRDFRAMPATGRVVTPAPGPGWRLVEVDPGVSRIRVPAGSALDLGATAKALAADRSARAADRSARAAAGAAGGAVLVSLGGDIATAGPPPPGGWAVGVGDSHALDAPADETVRLEGGGLATSGITVRRWQRGDLTLHHIVDPRTGLPAPEVWRTVSVAAAACVDANSAATAAIVRGDAAPGWLADLGLPARLVRRDGSVVRVAGWPGEVAA